MTAIFSEEIISEISERISILDIISPYVSLKKAGKYHKGLCPFHPDKNPSFIVNEERNTFHCFGCGSGGDIYSFFMKFHNCTFPQAVRELAQRAGISIPTKVVSDKEKETREEKETAFRINQIACEFFHEYLLKSADARQAREIFSRRGVDLNLIQEYHLGYAPNQWDLLYRHLKLKNAPMETAGSLGLVLSKKNGQGYYDRFRNRLMFPILDISGRILGFGGRVLGEGDPKYMNSPESILYNKRSSLFGLYQAPQSIRIQGYAIIVEGYFDLLSLHRFGFRHAVAVLGTSVTPQQIDLLGRYTRKVTLIFDGDLAGKKASLRSLENFFEKGFSVKIVFLPAGHDPDSYLLEAGPDSLQGLLEIAKPVLEAILDDRIRGKGELDTEKKIDILSELLPLVTKIGDPIEKNLRLKQIAEEIGIDEHLLREELSKYSRRVSTFTPERSKSEILSRLPPEEKLICQLLLQFPFLISQFAETNADTHILETFKNNHIKEVIEEITEEYEKKGSIHLSRILSGKDHSKMGEFLSQLTCLEEFNEEEASRALNDSMRRIRLRVLREEARELSRKIREAEKMQEYDLCLELSLKKQELLKKERQIMDL